MTVWRDDGAECLPHTILPTLMCVAEFTKGNFDMDIIKSRFKEIIGCEFDDFMLLDTFDMPGGKYTYSPGKYEGDASKYLLYNDLFMGLNDIYPQKPMLNWLLELLKRHMKNEILRMDLCFIPTEVRSILPGV